MADYEINQLNAGTLTPDSFLMADVPSGNSYTSGKINAQQFAGIATKHLNAADYALLSPAERNNGTQYVIDDEEGETNIADAFDETASYNAGDWCIHNNTLYCFNASKSAGAWDSTKADAKTLDDLLNINSLASGTIATNDKLMFIDIDDANAPKSTTAAAVAGLAFNTLTTADNNKLIGVSVSGSDISVVAVATGSQTLTFNSNSIDFIKNGDFIFVSADNSRFTHSQNTWIPIGTLDSGFYNPNKTIYTSFVEPYGHGIMLRIVSNGGCAYRVTNPTIQPTDTSSIDLFLQGGCMYSVR